MNPLTITTLAMEKHEEIQRWAEDWNRFEALRDVNQYDRIPVTTRMLQKIQTALRLRVLNPQAQEPCR